MVSNLDGSPILPPGPPLWWITYLPFISQKNLLNIKDVDFDFRMGCILVLFPFLWIINVQFTNFRFLNFFIFKYSDIVLLWSKITNFIIEITLKLLLHKKYGLNNPNWGRLGLKSPKLHFFAISESSKIISYTNIQIHVTRSIFIINWYVFLMLVTMSSIRINNNLNYQNLLITTIQSP